MKFLMIFALVFAVVLSITMGIILIYFKGFNDHISNVIAFILCVLLWIFILSWQFIIKPHYNKRIAMFSDYVKELTDKEMAKQQAIYNKFIKQKTENTSAKGE